MSKLLVTGARGFIGTPLVKKLRELAYEVIELSSENGDIADEETWRNLPESKIVLHLAARSFVPDSWNDPAGFMRTNVTGTENVLEYCRKHQARLVYVSAYLYGEPEHLPIKEADPVQPNNPYALSKHLAEQICEFYSRYWGLSISIIRPFNVYGPGQRSEFLIPEIVKQVLNSNEVCVKDSEPKRDYVYIDDMVDALVKALDAPDGFHVLNVGSGVSCSVAEVIDIIQHAAGTDLPVKSEKARRVQEISDVRADVTLALKVIGWSPSHSFADGVTKLLLTENNSEQTFCTNK